MRLANCQISPALDFFQVEVVVAGASMEFLGQRSLGQRWVAGSELDFLG